MLTLGLAGRYIYRKVHTQDTAATIAILFYTLLNRALSFAPYFVRYVTYRVGPSLVLVGLKFNENMSKKLKKVHIQLKNVCVVFKRGQCREGSDSWPPTAKTPRPPTS